MRLCDIAWSEDHARRQRLQLGGIRPVRSKPGRGARHPAAQLDERMLFRKLRRVAFPRLGQR